MNAREKNLVVLALLFTGVAGGGYYWFYLRDNVQGQAEQAVIVKMQAPPPATKIRLDMMADDANSGDAVNIFNYRKEKLEVAAPPPSQPLPPPPPPTNVLGTGRGNVQPATPSRPTTPAENVIPVNLAFSGFAREESGEMIAFLETTQGPGAPAGHYNLHEDDFLLGRFRIVKITESTVEYEDWDRSEATRKQPALSIRKLP